MDPAHPRGAVAGFLAAAAHPRGAVASFLAAAALPLLPAACEDEPPECDLDRVAIAIPAGDTLALHATICIERSADDDNPPRVSIWGDSDDHYHDAFIDLEIDADGFSGTIGFIDGEAVYAPAFCDDGLTLTLTNTSTADYTGVLHLRADAGYSWDRCEITLDPA